jgi:hypothetical protein
MATVEYWRTGFRGIHACRPLADHFASTAKLNTIAIFYLLNFYPLLRLCSRVPAYWCTFFTTRWASTIERDAWLSRNSSDSRYDLLWLAIIGWPGALVAMHNHAMPRGCRLAEPYEHNLRPNLHSYLNECMQINPARTIHRHSFIESSSQILSK